MTPELNHSPFDRWLPAFVVKDGGTELTRVLTMMEPEIGDIYTSMLPNCLMISEALSSGRVQMLRGGNKFSLKDVFETLMLIAHYSRVARTGALKPAEPGFFIRTTDGVRAAMPVDLLDRIAGRERVTLGRIVALLYKDGAIRSVRDGAGHAALVLNDGYVDDSRVRRFMRY